MNIIQFPSSNPDSGSKKVVNRRLGLPKTRSGCKTCKYRRVKCDKGKPECQKCIKFGVECEGYTVRPVKGSTPRAAAILPKPANHQAQSPSHVTPYAAPSSVAYPTSSVLHIQSVPAFENDQEFSSFLHFQAQAIPYISGTYDSSLWDHLIMQSCRVDSSLRRLATSIGALAKAREFRVLALSSPNNNAAAEKSKSLTEYSLLQYGRGLKDFVRDGSNNQNQGDVWTRKAMIASILIYCFESMNGQLASAMFQMSKALRLMQKQFEPETRRYKHLGSTTRHQRLEQDLMAALVRLDAGIMSRMMNEEEELALDLKGLKMSPGTRSRILPISFTQDVLGDSREFSNALEARKTIEYIQFWALPHLFDQFFPPAEKYPKEVDEHTKRVCETILVQLRQWKTAFQPLLTRNPQPKWYSKQHLALLTPRIQSLSYGIAVQRVYYRGTSTDLSHLNTDAREIIKIGKIIMGDPCFYRGFVFECEFLPGLFVVATSALDTDLRREAIELMRQTFPRQESGWDSMTLVKISEQLLALDAYREAQQ